MFIKKGKTNWTIIIVVALIAGAVGGGLVIYINGTVNETGLLISSSTLANPDKAKGKNEAQLQAIAIKDVLAYANKHFNDKLPPRIQTQGTISAIDYTPSNASIVITDNDGNYVLAVVSHAEMTAENSPYPSIVAKLEKNGIVGVSGTVSFTEPDTWMASEKTKLEAINLPEQIGLISVDGLLPSAE